MRSDRRVERGAALPLITLVMVLALLSGLVAAAVVGRASDRARAQAAADASALAGIAEGRNEAAALAVANGGQLVSFTEAGNRVVVEVAVNGVVARAAAERSLADDPGG